MKRFAPLLLCLLFCLTLLAPAALADFGSFSGDSDYGGSWDSGGSSWDSDWDSDWDSGSDYDYDSGEAISLAFLFDGPWGVIILVAIVLYYVLSRYRGRNRQQRTPVAPGAQRTAAASLQPMESYSGKDPNFDPAELSQRLSNWYVQMQNCWTAGDMTSLRPCFTDVMYTQFERQLESMKQQGLVNYVERISVLGVELKGWQERGGEDHIIAELRTRIVDYTVNADGEVVSGSKAAEKFMTYEWDLTRPAGQLTQNGDQMQVVNCPNCGAPLSMNESAKCPYCDSVITLESHDWVICSIKGISQQTTFRMES